ncbi:uncharacterized protein LOC131597811 [Vicia villosa]|uniref:uncharacterized protein LOC131597811 n=1 Tax=Vicia villosa TaxID=3911 RepID=UPI00273AD1E0|nr:uncharacterized protein LOC131597811 [Vicia villosa]
MDIQKAYDSVVWQALKSIMTEMSFPRKFIDWTMLVVTTVSYQLNNNGRVTKSMQANKGLRQGDSIYPLILMVVLKYLHRKLEDLQCIPNFNFYSKCEKLGIIDISFVDDVLLFFFVQLKMNNFGVFLKW